MNHFHKHQTYLRDLVPFPRGSEEERLIVMRISADARKLLILTKILGEDGNEFKESAGKIAQNLWNDPSMVFDLAMVTELVDMFRTLQAASGEFLVKIDIPPGWTPSTTDDKSCVDWEWYAWTQELLLGYDEQRHERCAFCGVACASPRKFQACAGCRITVYCDKTCQKYDWKKKHKAECKKKTEGRKAKDTKAENTQAIDS
jgi:hypothetical protein